MTGSSILTDEQRAWYLERFGKRYVTVQEQPLRPSRRVRRGRATSTDLRVLRAQQQTEKILRDAQVTAG